MYISKVLLKDVRSIRAVNIDLQRPDGRYAGWTVLAGRNGSGKSTLLKAIALAVVGPAAMRGLQQSFVGWVRDGEQGAIASTELVIDESDKFSDQGDVPVERIWAGLGWLLVKHGYEPALAALDNGTHIQLEPEIQESGPWQINPEGWFMVGYGPYRRLSGPGLDTQTLISGPPAVARMMNLFREDTSLIGGGAVAQGTALETSGEA